MTNPTLLNCHTPSNCTALIIGGGCSRVHVGDVVQVVVEQLGYRSCGTVTAISPIGGITVNFPDGVFNAEEYGYDQEDTEVLHFIESELDIMSV